MANAFLAVCLLTSIGIHFFLITLWGASANELGLSWITGTSTKDCGELMKLRQSLRATFRKESQMITDDRRKIFIDLGANDGASVSFFINPPSQTPNANGGGRNGAKTYSILRGFGSDGTWEVIVIEANADMRLRLGYLKTEALRKGLVKKFTLYNSTAIATDTGYVDFYYETAQHEPLGNNYRGATIMHDMSKTRGTKPRKIPALALVDMFDAHNIKSEDLVVVKMDVEGLEFELLRHFLLHSLHWRTDYLAIEWHDTNSLVYGYGPHVPPATHSAYQTKHKCLNWMFEPIGTLKILPWG